MFGCNGPTYNRADSDDVPSCFPITSFSGEPGSGGRVFFPPAVQGSCEEKDDPSEVHLSWEHLVTEQKQDPSLLSLFDLVVSKEEIAKMASGYYCINNVLHKWTPPFVSLEDDDDGDEVSADSDVCVQSVS